MHFSLRALIETLPIKYFTSACLHTRQRLLCISRCHPLSLNFRWLVLTEKSSSRTAHSWCRYCSWPCACVVSRDTRWPATCCTISYVPQRSPTPQTTAVYLVASTDPCKSTCPLRYQECVQHLACLFCFLKCIGSLLIPWVFSSYFLALSTGLGSSRGPMAPGDPLARSQRRGDRICVLCSGPAAAARAPAPAEIRTGRAGHEQVRGQKCTL